MTGLKLLAADDEDIVRAFIKKVIEREKLPVEEFHEAASGPEAVRLALEHHPDVILMDNRMPGFSGLKACEMILKERPSARIIMLSAHDDFDCVRRAFTSGARDYLLKPVHHQQLADLLRKVMAEPPASEPDEPAGSGNSLVRAVKNFIDDNLEGELPLTDIARAVFISPYHLSRKFKKITGQPLKDYIFARRMARALDLLNDPEISVTEAALKCGYGSPGYFATCFKAHTGQSPSQYRQNLFASDGKN